MGRRNPDHQNQFRHRFSLSRLKSYRRRRRQSEQLARAKSRASQGHRLVVEVPRIPDAKEHHITGEVIEAPPELQRFENAEVNLENPKKLTDAEIAYIRRVGHKRGWNVRYYDPATYNPESPGKTGIHHEKAFPLEQKEELNRYLNKKGSGDVDSSVESSRGPRRTLEEIWVMPNGDEHRITIDASKLM